MGLFNIKTLGAAATALCLSGFSASAATLLFDDDFERSANNSVGFGWTEVARSENDVRILNNDDETNGRVLLRDSVDRNGPAGSIDAGIRSSTIDATGFENLEVTFRWRARANNAATDTLNVSFSDIASPGLGDLSDWTNVFSTDSSVLTTNTTETIFLTGVSDTEFSLFFSTEVANNNSAFVLFGVSVVGDEIAVVPLPAGMPLMLLGLGALGVAHRRSTKG